MFFRQIFDESLAQYAYMIGCQQTKEALLIDPERDIDRYVRIAEAEGLTITAVAETHIHADFLSGARAFAEQYGTHLYLSDEGDADWKYEWIYQGPYNYTLLNDGDTFRIGHIEIKAVHTPGHTPEHIAFLVTDYGGGATEPMGMVTGDFVFVGDLGRPDLLESAAKIEGMMDPSARRLYGSVQRFLDLPDYLQIWPGHGAGSACGKALGAVPNTTLGYERRFNTAIDAAGQGEQAFVDFILEGQPEPPMYFARMKQLNKVGAPVLPGLPQPKPLMIGSLDDLADRKDIAVIDTRLDHSAFFGGHIPGALYAPFDKTFPTIVGSYVDPEMPIYLVIDEHQLDAAVRNLVRIGYDHVVGYVTPNVLEQYQELDGRLDTISTTDFDYVNALRDDDPVQILDVRTLVEFEAAHVPDAMNIAHTRLMDHIDEIPKTRPVWVHCATGRRAASAAAYLKRYGYDVVHVNDGFASWESSNRVAL